MPLLLTGKKFIRTVEKSGAVGIYVPSEGGFEGRYKRRLRAAGYLTLFVSAPGMGDLASYFTDIHGVRPPHLGKNQIRTYFLPPFVTYQLENLPPQAKGLALWLYDGKRLAQQELAYLDAITATEPRLKVVVELGGARSVEWQPLADIVAAA
ncbi:NAD(P)H-quinone oxidoreductase subunit N [Acaryochloris sp. IP29b_bin.148]|uniref:NAD(P)H-quinone oxidoreductase subunit N n=1 Tax=Acaryochloris sp. IP29b_bin.148 TaxID=2969218 RepID=UPI0026058CAF|nr:NAD(P)H-quinone oxidoreductase subunit N [Acaryochloris sp. IP29b_bin.148]